ncbi:mucin-like glycoprotein [Trypanosoma conorhini]|uniref:Mucin-like glycoprotein n=1 Tax=Trypanosoma conorhini TaxID=83891 RepID=A0A3R7KEW0_9TRYP|nr:mucin-like glycoprotein [Trypanosoma conorhini]RNE99075.1 mucin-like glycoprotein [Trypanosoma conorhini]
MTTLAVRRRVVCALALLALLCGCCASFVCGANPEEVNVLLEVSCPNEKKKLRWRVAGEETWQNCSFGVNDMFGLSGKYGSPSDSVCAWAVFMYPSPVRYPGRSGSAATDAVALTLKCGTDNNSGVYKRWLIANKSNTDQLAAAAGSDPPGTLTRCTTQTSSGEACGEVVEEDEEEDEEEEEEEEEETQRGGDPTGAEGRKTETAPASRGGGPQRPQGGDAGAAGDDQGVGAEGPTARNHAENTAAPSAAAAASQPHESGGTQTPPTSQAESGASSPAPPAGGSDATTTTTATATTSTSSDGSHAKSKAGGSATNSNTTQNAVANAADRSATSTPFVCAPLMLLLTAALACAAG